MNPLKQLLSQTIQQALTKYGVEKSLGEIESDLNIPPKIDMGHFAFPCFSLSKVMRKKPNIIAEELKALIEDTDAIQEVRNLGPYLNFFMAPQAMGSSVAQAVLGRDMFQQKLAQHAPKTMIEYSQPNTHKELHVGHMRNICLGDSLIRLHQYCGFDIISSTFPGDMGTHVAKCLWYLKYHNTEPMPETEKGAWLGKMYSRGSMKIYDTDKSEDEAAKETYKAQLSEILTQLESEEGEFYELWKSTREWSIDQMKKVYDWADVTFDKWYWESEVDVPSVKLIQEYYDRGEVFIESKGVIGADLEAYNLGFCVLIKSDGHGLYATKDIELARRKFEDYKIEKSVYVVDERQAHHFKQVFKILELMGFENAQYCHHLAYNYVELPEGPMSSRKGNIIPLMDLIRQMEHTTKTELKNRYEGEWTEEEMDRTATIIAKGAIRYGMLKIDATKKIVFDMKEWLDLSGDSGPYLQYVYARIVTLCKKQGYDPAQAIDWSALQEKEEIAILLHLSNFNAVALNACHNYRISSVCTYLYELAKLYNSFYNEHSIAKAESDAIRFARLGLSKAVSDAMREGLALLGIPVPEKM
ncbi:MAG: arginine--tRNA ligase [Bacteroidota bacterium]